MLEEYGIVSINKVVSKQKECVKNFPHLVTVCKCFHEIIISLQMPKKCGMSNCEQNPYIKRIHGIL